ncbi:MAG: hypothetical protein SF187_17985 [Deltaproteobacteria bacterium]|nr:hypothetical protein [Deltaproteobacteria bacterium]
MKRALLLAALVMAPKLAWACPVCAGRETNTTMIATLLGLMIAVPYAVAVVVIRVIRKADKESAWPAPPLPEAEGSRP